MDQILGVLDSPRRILIVELLLGLREDPPVGPRGLTQVELCTELGIAPKHRSGLKKSLDPLREAGLVTTSPGPRADQPLFRVRQPELLLELLRTAARLDAAVTEEAALLLHAEAELKAEKAQRLSQKGGESDDPAGS